MNSEKDIIKPLEVKQEIKPLEVKQDIKPLEVKQDIKPLEVTQGETRIATQEVKQDVKPTLEETKVVTQEVTKVVTQEVKPLEEVDVKVKVTQEDNLFSKFLDNKNKENEKEDNNTINIQDQQNLIEQENIKNILDKNINLSNNLNNLNNINNINNYVKFTDNKFNFYDNNQVYLNSFTIEDVINYINSKYIKINQNLLIEKYICYIKFNRELKSTNIVLRTRQESYFMADFELILNLNKLLSNFVENDLDNYLNVHVKHKNMIKYNVLTFNILLLNYILELIELILIRVKDNKIYVDSLVKFSTRVVSKIDVLINEQFNLILIKTDSLKNLLVNSLNMRKIINEKLDVLINASVDLDKEDDLSNLSNLSYETTPELSRSVQSTKYNYSDDSKYVSEINKID
jgi:hypothetical protein